MKSQVCVQRAMKIIYYYKLFFLKKWKGIWLLKHYPFLQKKSIKGAFIRLTNFVVAWKQQYQESEAVVPRCSSR